MPFFFSQGGEAKQLHQIFADQQIGVNSGNLTDAWQSCERSFGTIHQIPNTAHVNQNVIKCAILNPACEFANHALAFATAAAKLDAPP
jgi:hypothetical protein